MSLFSSMAVAGSGLEAQGLRLNTIASNLANANVVAGSAESAYRARLPVFEAMYSNMKDGAVGVRLADVRESSLPALQEYNPGHPLADPEGYIYRPQINAADEMANMISASRSYQSGIEAMNTTKQLLLRTLTLGS